MCGYSPDYIQARRRWVAKDGGDGRYDSKKRKEREVSGERQRR